MPATIYAPDTDLRLLSVPLTMGDGQQLDFATVAAQTAYFQGKTVKTYADFSYQRKDHYIAVPDVYDNLLTCNYVMYRNTAHGTKWFYAFIERVEFVNQNCSHIYIKTDVFQTWLFDFSFLPSLVRRECVADDSLWKHTLPEPVPTGDAKIRATDRVAPSGITTIAETYSQFLANYWVCVIVSEEFQFLTTDPVPAAASFLYGNPNACYYYACPLSSLYDFINEINSEAKMSAVLGIVAVPKGFVHFNALTSAIVTDLGYLTEVSYTHEFTITKNTTDIDGYTPKNKKLFCYPYNYLMLQCGDNEKTLRYEHFTTPANAQELRMQYMLSADPVYGVYPLNYNGQPNNERAGVALQTFPPIPYSYSAYQQYIATHINTLGLQLVETVGGVVAGAFTGGAGGALYAAAGIPNMIASHMDMAREPRQMRGQLSGNWLAAIGKNAVYLHRYTIRAEYARIVDDYFSRYGYRVDTLKTPSFKNRPKWDYLLTENCAISGDIPASDATELQGLFNSGLTVWHDASHFGDYSQNNAPT